MAFTPEDVQRLLNNKARKEENRTNGIVPPVIQKNTDTSRYAFTPDQVQRKLNNKASKIEYSNRATTEKKSTVSVAPPVSAPAEPKKTTFVLPTLEEKTKTDLSKIRFSGYQPEKHTSSEAVKLPSAMLEKPTASQVLTDGELVEKFLSPDYKLTKAEEKEADRIIRDYRKNNEANMTVEQARALREQAADPNSYYNKILALERKTNDTYAFTLNALNALPFLRNAVDKYAEKQNDPTIPTMSEQLEVARKQNPVSSGLGSFAGTAGTYAVGGKVLQSVPVLSAAATKTGKALEKLPVLGKMGAERLGHVVADTGVDFALDTLPRLADDLESGKTTGEAAWNAAKNIGGNFAMNVGSDVLGSVTGKLFDFFIEQTPTATFNADIGPEHNVQNEPRGKRTSDSGSFNNSVEDNAGGVNESNAKFMSNDALDNARKPIVDERLAYSNNRVQNKIMNLSGKYNVVDENAKAEIDAIENNIRNILNNVAETGKARTTSGQDYKSLVVEFGKLDDLLQKHGRVTVTDDYGMESLRRLREAVQAEGGKIYVSPEIQAEFPDGIRTLNNEFFGNRITFTTKAGDGVPLDTVIGDIEKMTDFRSTGNPIDDVSGLIEYARNAKRSGTGSVSYDSSITDDMLDDALALYDEALNASKTTYTGGTLKEESYARNVARGRVEDVPEEVKNEFIGNPELYEVLSNKDTLAQAQAIYESGNAESQIYRLLSKKEPVAIPLGNQIVKDMIASGRRDEAVELMRSMSNSLRAGGQFTQAAAIGMMRSDPKTAMRYVIRDIDDINAIGRKKFGKRWVDVELKDEEIDAFDEIIPGDTDAIKEAVKTVNDRVAKEYPSTVWEKVVELSKVSMLLNPRTQIRNVVSNAMLLPVRSITDRVSALGQHAMHLVNPNIKITQSLTGGGREEKALANEVWESVKENILGNSSPKYENGIKGSEKDKQIFKGTVASRVFDRIFPGAIAKANEKMGKSVDNSLLETARNFTYYLLEQGDQPFVKNNFVNRLASYMKAQGIKSIDDLPEEAISLAAEEALKATFKDDNTLTKVFSDLKRTTGKVGEVVMPFTKTPANLAMRGIDYSPAGLVTAFKMARNGKGASEIMDHIAKSLTGTAAIGAGYVLAKNGIISGALSSDKDEAAFQKQQGQQAYSINIDGNYYSYDWAQPSSIPIILGASIYQSIEESDEEARTALEKFERGWDMTKQAGVSAANSWMELSPLQSIADIFDTSYGGSVPENFINEVLEFPQRLVPTAMGATARAIDPVQRQTFSSGHPIQTQMNVLKSKVPYLSETLPAARDTWGNEIRRSDTTREAAFAQFANPGQFGNDAKTPIDDEIQRLFDETDTNAVFPRKSNWKVGDTKLTNEQYSELQRQQGQKSYELADAFIGSDVYDSFSDADRAEIMGNLYGYAKAVAEQEMFGKEMSAANAKLHRIYTDLGAEGIARYYAYKQQADTDGNGGISKKELVPFLDSQPLSRSERRAYFSYLNTGNNPY